MICEINSFTYYRFNLNTYLKPYKRNYNMKNWNSIVYALSGGLLYIISTEILPEWSHLLVSLLAAGVFMVAYWLIPNKMKTWLRVLISAAVSLAVVALVRLICY